MGLQRSEVNVHQSVVAFAPAAGGARSPGAGGAPDPTVRSARRPGGEGAAQVFLAGQAGGARGVPGEGLLVGDDVFGAHDAGDGLLGGYAPDRANSTEASCGEVGTSVKMVAIRESLAGNSRVGAGADADSGGENETARFDTCFRGLGC